LGYMVTERIGPPRWLAEALRNPLVILCVGLAAGAIGGLLVGSLFLQRDRDLSRGWSIWTQATALAWDALGAEQYPLAIAVADLCIDTFEARALQTEAGLKAAGKQFPTGQVDAQTRQEIFSYGPLYDTATCYFIKASAYDAEGRIADTYHTLTAIAQFPHARIWNPDERVFWSPAEVASQVLGRFSHRVMDVSPSDFPFAAAGIFVSTGDLLEIRWLGGEWACQPGIPTGPQGRAAPEVPPEDLFFTGGTLCQLLATIDDKAIPLATGDDTGVSLDVSTPGVLQLGANDVPPERCQLEDTAMCYGDNQGSMQVEIVVRASE
jgi:hypothetical protein